MAGGMSRGGGVPLRDRVVAAASPARRRLATLRNGAAGTVGWWIPQATRAGGPGYCGNAGPACRAVSAGYAAQVLTWARRYGTTVGGVADAAAIAVRAAMSQLGTPYLWGGESPAGFDCSGLVQWAYAHAGVALPRVAQDQYDAGPAVPRDQPLLPGDLVFFGAGPRAVSHVGLYLGDGRFVDAPHTGATVRVDVLTGFTLTYLGATRPSAGTT